MKALVKGSVFVALALLLVAGPASATLIAVDDPFTTDSWAQRFQEDGVYPGQANAYDHFQARLIINGGGGPFDNPPPANATLMTAFSPNSWTSGGTANTAWADVNGGVTVHGLTYWNFNFDGVSSKPVTFNFSVWNDNVMIGSTDITWSPGWSYPAGSKNETYIPEPISMVMLGGLGAGMFVARKLRGKRAA